VLREVVNAILYLLRTGCRWRLLPKDFPPKSTVYGDFRRLGQDGVWHQIWLVLTMAAREQAGREGAAERRHRRQPERQDHRSRPPTGFDAGKKVNGRKRHLLTDTLGLPFVGSGGASLGLSICSPTVATRAPSPPTHGSGLEIVKRPAEAQSFVVLSRRWGIERSFAWLSRNRGRARDFERRIEASTAIVALTIIQLLTRGLANH
jgi:transposase